MSAPRCRALVAVWYAKGATPEARETRECLFPATFEQGFCFQHRGLIPNLERERGFAFDAAVAALEDLIKTAGVDDADQSYGAVMGHAIAAVNRLRVKTKAGLRLPPASERPARPTIAVDFDGVLHEYRSKFTNSLEIHDPPVVGAQAFVAELLRRGFDVVVFTCRTGAPGAETAILNWLYRHRFDRRLKIEVAMKPHADLYIDDRGYRFFGDFDHALEYCGEPHATPKPWNKAH